MACICEGPWKALCALKDAITKPCRSGGDDQPLTQSNNNSNVSIDSNLNLEEHVIRGDLGIGNTGFDNASFENSSDGGTWRSGVLRFHDPVTDEPHTDSGHWTTTHSVFTDVDLGDSKGYDEVDGTGKQTHHKQQQEEEEDRLQQQRSDSTNTARESGYGRSLDDSNNSSTSQEPSVSVAYHARPTPGVSTTTANPFL